MIGKKFRNLLIVAGLASAAVAVVPAMTQAKSAGVMDAPIYVDQPVVTTPVAMKASVAKSKLKMHTTTKLASTKKLAAKKVASKKKAHTATIFYKHHSHKNAAVVKAKKHSA